MRRFLLLTLPLLSLLEPAPGRVWAETIHLQRGEKSVEILAGDQPFAVYVFDSGGKPILWPIHGPTGALMTRSYPMAKVDGEKTDHVHQRSLWFTHGDVNGVSFWMEEGKRGTIVQRELITKEGPPAVIETVNDWLDPEGRKLLEDRRVLAFAADPDRRIIDFSITLRASAGPVKFGDTKEGTFGIRVPTSMDVDAKGGGRIVNSQGLADQKAWGQPAAWVDYSGPVAGETVGIAVLNHPTSFRYPTRWHVRTYGLFAANPFGLKEFTEDEASDGSVSLAAGESLTLRYRVILHAGDAQAGQVAEQFKTYAESGPAELEGHGGK
jgi:hypothetical protein